MLVALARKGNSGMALDVGLKGHWGLIECCDPTYLLQGHNLTTYFVIPPIDEVARGLT